MAKRILWDAIPVLPPDADVYRSANYEFSTEESFKKAVIDAGEWIAHRVSVYGQSADAFALAIQVVRYRRYLIVTEKEYVAGYIVAM